ncbi:helix-turn-helix transcriptional regulator [Flavobacterium degerlachei]|jgi:transcriptional regulator with XRE-family HTH domain|uniref:Helix-turn-helix n=1 Tax=Flavobacterium degerlachei TaxID=229203 RepID=A0A1H3F191_9FLAO|nr:helix-turn-helix transcriptional regulator [Flavobacterium degerlachei]SDX84761.1 Helix-turn-helix [Flavobacterium degerlachei]
MVNTEEFIKRLEVILDYYSLNASAFADKIGVQRSSLSHLLSGRNKPSLDFILKILDVFPDVDLYWILNGKGSFPKNNETIQMQEEKQHKEITPSTSDAISEPLPTQNLFSKENDTNQQNKVSPKKEEIQNVAGRAVSEEVEKIVFFYKDGTFKEFKPN